MQNTAHTHDLKADNDFPTLVENTKGHHDLDDTITYLKSHKNDIETALYKTGTVLFRNFPIHTPDDFDAVIAAFDYPNFPYKESLSNALRTNITDRVFTANEAPPEVDIFLHHELAQTPMYPSKLFFFCEIAPDIGGATPLCRSDILLEQMRESLPELTQKFEDLGLKYSNIFGDCADTSSGQGRSWKSLLNVDDKLSAEAALEKLGYTYEWLDTDCLKITTPTLPAIRQAPNGADVFFNQLIAAFRGWKDSRNDPSKAVTFGDGSPIDTDDMNTVIALSDALIYDCQWQKGDVALIDNFLVMHGRKHFEGKRRVLASLIL